MTNTRLSHNTTDVSPAHLLAVLAGKTAIGNADVAALHQTQLAIGLLSRRDAEAMFAIERSPVEKCRAWGDLLVACLLDFIVWGERPTGILTDQQAQWLCAQVGDHPTPACLALLVSVLEEASTVPNWFASAVRIRAAKAFGAHGSEPQRAAA